MSNLITLVRQPHSAQDIHLNNATEYWVYVDVLSGKYVSTAAYPRALIVFASETAARQEEQHSLTLSMCVCHAVNFSEMLAIAAEFCSGRYKIIIPKAIFGPHSLS